MIPPRQLLPMALVQPGALLDLDLRQWDLTLRLARRAGLLARIGTLLADGGWLADVPEQPRRHIEADLILSDKHARDVRWEVESLRRTLFGAGIRAILLKGAAYVTNDLPAARGRFFSDIDIMVPKDDLDRAERALRGGGWISPEIHPYDEHYYRTWMHQIPPVVHVVRGSVIDVHHTIVPETTRIGITAAALRDAAQPIPGHEGLLTLAPTDMVLHSATHLVNEGEFDRALRDLSDLDLLLRHFADEAFWGRLVERAQQLDLERPLFYALTYVTRIFDTPVPSSTVAWMANAAPGRVTMATMRALFDRALQPEHESCRDPLSGFALWLLYVRAHHLRMPPHLLIPHLIRKAVRRRLDH